MLRGTGTSMVLRRCRGEVTRDQQPEAFRYDEAAPPSENPYFAGSLYSRYDVPWRVSAAVTIAAVREVHKVGYEMID